MEGPPPPPPPPTIDRVSFLQVKTQRRSGTFQNILTSQLRSKINFTIQRSLFLYVTFFSGTPNTSPTLFDSKYSYVKYCLLERYCSFSRPMFKNFAVFNFANTTRTC